MIRLLKRNDIDESRWNRTIEESESGEVFYKSWYLDVCAGYWEALVKDDYEAVFPLAPRSRFGVHYLYQPFFTRHFGLVGKSAQEASLQQLFLQSIPDRYRYHDFCLPPHHTAVLPDAVLEQKRYQVLELSREYTDLRGCYHDNCVRNLRKAERAKLRFGDNPDIALLVDSFRRDREKTLEEFRDEHYVMLQQLMETARKRTHTFSVAVYEGQGKPVAGAFFILDCHRLLYLKGFTSGEGRKNGAMHFLFDSMIRKFAGQRLILDFGGSSLDGIARFFSSFGSSDCLYLRHQVNRLPLLFRWIK